MTVSIVQQQAVTGTSKPATVKATFTSAPTAGNSVFALVGLMAPKVTGVTVSPSVTTISGAGATWILASSSNSGIASGVNTANAFLWAGQNCGTGVTITCTPTWGGGSPASSTASMIIFEASGIGTTATLDVSPTTAAGTASPNFAATQTNIQTDDFAVAMFCGQTPDTSGPTNGFASLTHAIFSTGQSTQSAVAVAYMETASIVSVSTNWNTGGARWASVMALYQVTTVAPTVIVGTPQLMLMGVSGPVG